MMINDGGEFVRGRGRRPRGLKPASIWTLYAALKRRSSTGVDAFGWLRHGLGWLHTDSDGRGTHWASPTRDRGALQQVAPLHQDFSAGILVEESAAIAPQQ